MTFKAGSCVCALFLGHKGSCWMWAGAAVQFCSCMHVACCCWIGSSYMQALSGFGDQ